jgi:hypothetical protein
MGNCAGKYQGKKNSTHPEKKDKTVVEINPGAEMGNITR